MTKVNPDNIAGGEIRKSRHKIAIRYGVQRVHGRLTEAQFVAQPEPVDRLKACSCQRPAPQRADLRLQEQVVQAVPVAL